MRQLLFDHDEEVANWVMDKLPIQPKGRTFGAYRSIGVLYKGDLVAGVVYNSLTDDMRDCHMTIASSSPHWAGRLVLRALFDYPFNQLGVARVTATTNQKNKKSKDLLKRLGFMHEGCIRYYYNPNEGALIYGMLKSECKWIEDTVKNGQPIQHA